MKRIALLGAMLCLFLSIGYAAQNKTPPAGKKEFVFKGKVEKVDATAKSLTVNGQNVQGWMSAMTMNYSPDKEDVFKKIKVGDEITAKVYEGDFRTLYDIQVVPKSAAPADKGGKK
jgi:Cu/Ag efflux protein CusF